MKLNEMKVSLSTLSWCDSDMELIFVEEITAYPPALFFPTYNL